MRHLLFIDSETTGSIPHKARLCELAYISASCYRQELKLEAEGSWLIYPTQLDQYPLPDTTRIHGITGDEMLEQGTHLPKVLEELAQAASKSLNGGFPLIVGHNVLYDTTVLAAEHRRCSREYKPFDLFLPFCTMRSMKQHTVSRGFGPSLQNAWNICYPTAEYPEGHRAGPDVHRCFEVYQHGLERGWWSCD